MKVFISWSGELSREVAILLRDWLPSVIQIIHPYVSSEDIDKGARWTTDIAGELEKSFYGILCITKANIEAPWINFEAGALSKSVENSRVSPFLFGIKRSDIKSGPLTQFQSTLADRDDIFKLVHSLNQSCEAQKLDPKRLDEILKVWWPQLENKLDHLLKSSSSAGDMTTQPQPTTDYSEILEEVLELLRQQNRIINSPEILLPAGYIRNVVGRSGGLPLNHPVYRDLAEVWSETRPLLQAFKEDDKIPASIFAELLKRLHDPIEYILRRVVIKKFNIDERRILE